MIGLDTSHVVRFTEIINNTKQGPAAGVKVVAAYRGGSPDLPISADRIDGFTKTLREKYQVEIVDSIDALLKRVDVILLESVDGRPHLEQARPVILAGKPLFIDKPIAASLADTIEIFELAQKHKVPVFSSSSLRFNDTLRGLRGGTPEIGKIVRCDAAGSINPLKGHPDLAFYGIHGIEMLFTVMGPGCKTVTWQKDGLVKGEWEDGRIGTFAKGSYKVKVTGTKGSAESGGGSYGPLINEICTFFKTGKPPVAAEETINLFAFIVAAQKSKDNGNVPVTINEVMEEARRVIKKRN
ncbi:MAG: Gfo/Idh/MocA family oxidoreductase [Planctomycetes bacterium]|nr:Gfo/Idh/MocA family oxidoreductase [Planctomycetota bacterium]